jgi:CDP-diacylglycerol--glycerol-3-phosphate 3-phosphatidyltransferase
MNLPNQLTVARCIMSVVFVGLMAFENLYCYVTAYAVFTVAAITDHYDGRIARERNLITNFGKLLDPVADKVLMLSAYLVMIPMADLRIPPWAIMVILAREFVITGARSLAASEGVVLPANKWGKRKTVFQMVYVFTFLFFAIALLFLRTFDGAARYVPGGVDAFAAYIGWASLISVIFVAAYTVYSGIQFARVNWQLLRLDDL